MSDLESLETDAGPKAPVVTVTMHFRIFDQEAFDFALEDLVNADVFGEGEGPEDNTVEENLEILITHLDVLANYRENMTTSFYDIGIERLSRD